MARRQEEKERVFLAEGSEKWGKLYPEVMERKEHCGQEGGQSHHHRDGEQSRKGGKGPG